MANDKKVVKLKLMKPPKRTTNILGLMMGAIDPDTGKVFATENFSIPWGMVSKGEHLNILQEWAVTVYAKQILKQGRISEDKIPKEGDELPFEIGQDDIDKHMKRVGVIKDE